MNGKGNRIIRYGLSAMFLTVAAYLAVWSADAWIARNQQAYTAHAIQAYKAMRDRAYADTLEAPTCQTAIPALHDYATKVVSVERYNGHSISNHMFPITAATQLNEALWYHGCTTDSQFLAFRSKLDAIANSDLSAKSFTGALLSVPIFFTRDFGFYSPASAKHLTYGMYMSDERLEVNRCVKAKVSAGLGTMRATGECYRA
ncbi:MAG: hypothetical protein WBW92_00680 [Rhodanobacteraceae bacterium]